MPMIEQILATYQPGRDQKAVSPLVPNLSYQLRCDEYQVRLTHPVPSFGFKRQIE